MKFEIPDDLTKCDGKALDVLARQARDLDIALQVELARRGSIDRAALERARWEAIPPGRRGVVKFLEGGKYRMIAIAIGVACLANARTCADFGVAAIERVAAAEQKMRDQQQAQPSPEVQP